MSDIMTLIRPRGWKLHRLGQLFRERKEKGSDKEFPPLSVTMGGIVPQLETAAKSDDGDNRKVVRIGDYVINSRSDRKGSGGISDHEGSVSLISIVLEPRNIEPCYAHHLLRSPAFQEEFYRWGHGIVADLWTTRYADMKNIRLVVPDLATQRQIADFLDRETARIDLLIRKKQRLVALLREKLSSTISSAVTGGNLSGVSRFGAESAGGGDCGAFAGGGGVMMHRLRDVAIVLTSNVDKVIDPDEHPVRLCNYVDVYKNNFIHNDMPFKPGSATAAEIKKFRVQVDDVIITKDSETADDIGVPALVKSATDDLVCGYHLSILRADRRRMIGPFLYWHLLSKQSREDFGNAANGVTRYGLTLGGIRGVPVNVPDLATQRQIADFLDRETARIGNLSDKVKSSIELLKDYRSALITAAVTGQIDVQTYARSGAADRRLDAIQEEMNA